MESTITEENRMYRMDELEISENDLGEEVVVMDIDSNLLSGLNVDTYQTFNGDSWLEYETSYHTEERGFPENVFDFTYDHSGINEGLALASIESMMGVMFSDEIIESCEYVSSYSPRFYNFETDSYRATYTVNRTKLNAWVAEREIDLYEYSREYHSSYDGFLSFTAGRLADPDTEEGTLLWLSIDAYFRETLRDDESYFYGVAEAEHEIYSNNTTPKMDEDVIREALMPHFESATPEGEYTEDWIDQLRDESLFDDYETFFRAAESSLEDGYSAQWDTIIGRMASILRGTAQMVQIEGQTSLEVGL